MQNYLRVLTSRHPADESEVTQKVSLEAAWNNYIQDTYGNENRTSLMGDDPYIMSVETG